MKLIGIVFLDCSCLHGRKKNEKLTPSELFLTVSTAPDVRIVMQNHIKQSVATTNSPLYSMKPSLRNSVHEGAHHDRVVPIISARVSWLTWR